jgi:hypothetical protein
VIVARLVDLRNGEAVVEIKTAQSYRYARAEAVGTLSQEAIGCEVAVMFMSGDPERPIVLGVMEEGMTQAEGGPLSVARSRGPIVLDAEKLVLSAHREIVIRCGAASITLTKAGKVLIQGEYLLSRAIGLNRVKGASVQIN